MFRLLVALFYLLVSSVTFSQEKYRYVVSFKDKGDVAWMLDKPELFLSEKSIERRNKFGIEINEEDLPVNQEYIVELSKKFRVIGKSKWLNLAMVEVDAHSDSLDLKNYYFVDGVKWVGTYVSESPEENIYSGDVISAQLPETYGYMANILPINGIDRLHELGFKGKGKLIAVMDDGFCAVDKINGGWKEHILGAYDFVDGRDDLVYKVGWHGTRVFSSMATNLDNIYIGAAPDASYVLLRTEYLDAEQPAEEYYWCFAAEFADSLGVDVINTSLGYNIYDVDFVSHTHDDLDGRSVMSRSADIAASRGIIVVCSAGNEGNKEWRKITVPADANNVLSIGGLERNSSTLVAAYSSYGPTADGRVKPDVLAPGTMYTITKDGNIESGYGTSFSSPVVAGAMACLSQALPGTTSSELVEIVRKTASSFDEPDERIGYGTADFWKAYVENGGTHIDASYYGSSIQINEKCYFVPVQLDFYKDWFVDIYSLDGNLVYHGLYDGNVSLPNLCHGVYILIFKSSNVFYPIKIVM